MPDAYSQNFELHVGDTRTLRFTLVNADGTPAEVGLSATGRFWVARNSRATDIPIKKDGVVTRENGQSVLTVELSSEDTIDLLPGKYYHEAEVTDGPVVLTISSGNMTLKPSLVR